MATKPSHRPEMSMIFAIVSSATPPRMVEMMPVVTSSSCLEKDNVM